MKENKQHHEDDKDNQQYYRSSTNQHHCCCCCYCCCYSNNNSNQQQRKNTSSSEEEIPPWKSSLQSPINHYDSRLNMESICSCCSCISSFIEIEEIKKEEEEDELPSTGCTTPIADMIKVIDNSIEIEKSRKKKLHAIGELLQTERDYVQDLSHLVEVCLEVLSRQTWITAKHKDTITRNSGEILEFHKQFINSFELTDSDSSVIAKKFIDQMVQFSLYKHYCDMHAEAWTLASEYRDRPEWNHFIKDCTILVDSTSTSYSIPLNLNHSLLYESSNQQQQQQRKLLHFEDYLIKPVQRICRYQLLIKEIIKYTPPQTSEYDLWTIVLSEMQDIVSDIDNRKFQRDMKERTDKFIARLEGDWRISKRHVSQLGSLLIAGAIEVTYSALGQTVSKPRYLGCFIFQTYVIMVRPKKVTSYEPKHWFPLRMTEFEDLVDIEGQREHSFVLRCKKHAFAFSASCLQEKLLWVKKIQEAIVAAKIEASDENLSAQDFIVSSLPGITSKRSPQSIRLSRSFTNLLDITPAANSPESPIDNHKKSNSTITVINNDNSPAEKRNLLRRSASTSIQFDNIMKITMQQPPLPTSKTITNITAVVNDNTKNNLVSLKKRYSADYSAFATRQQQQQHQLGLKPRNNSEMYIKPDSFGAGGSNSGLLSNTRRRPSSLDLLSAAANNTTTNMIGKMSSQLKNNHQNALRVTVDHKLRDVCTQEYLSSRAWHMRDRDALSSSSSYYQSSPIDTVLSSNQLNRNNSDSKNSTDALKKRKSSSFIRSSASSFSIMIPKRTTASEIPTANNNRCSSPRYQSEYELQSNATTSSCSSSVVDRSLTPIQNTTSRRPSQSSQLLRKISQNNNKSCNISESPISFGDNDSSISSFNGGENTNRRGIERSPSKRQIFVGKILRRIASFHQKTPSPSATSFDYCSNSSSSFNFSSGLETVEVEVNKKAASVGMKSNSSNKIRWKNRQQQHEELVQLKVSDRPTSMVMLNSHHQLADNTSDTSTSTIPVISAFAYASTPPSTSNIPTPRKNSSNSINRSWKNRLSLIRPSSFLKISTTTTNGSSNNNSSSIFSSSTSGLNHLNNSGSYLS